MKRLSFVMDDDDFSELVATVIPELGDEVGTSRFRDLYRQRICDADSWPEDFLLIDDRTVHEGILVRSLSQKIEGRTTGSRRKCASKKCPGWFIGVLWETGQQMYICSEGWHYARLSPDDELSISIIGGGEISARFVSPKPLGVFPLDKSEWPKRQDLMKRKGWRKSEKYSIQPSSWRGHECRNLLVKWHTRHK